MSHARTAPAFMAFLLLTMTWPASARALNGQRNIGWGDTGWDYGDLYENCAAPGEVVLVTSFYLYENVEVLGLQAAIDFCTMPHDLPDWWQFEQPGGCREGALSVSADFSGGPSTHEDFWGGLGVADFTFTTNHMGEADRARIAVTVTLEPGQEAIPLTAGTEYYAFRLILAPPAGDCAGCATPACFVINELDLVTTTGPVKMWGDAYTSYARWQGGQGDCPFIVAVESGSWGRMKALYR